VLIDEATLKEEAGRIIGVRSAIQDITELKRAEEKIIASLKEKEVLLKEIHHRVRNNLTTIVSILSLQAPYLEDRKSQEIFRECENRVRTMSKIHTKLYQSKDLAHIDFGSYLRELSSELFMSYQVNPEAIDLEIDVDDIELDINAALPLGLLLTELITNSLKYAFPGGRKGRLQVNLQKVVDRMVLSVADDGIGFPEHLDYQNTTSLGLQLVMGLVRQLDGTIDMKREQGTAFNITFPEAK
jgi:two-component sensor histidine kinase